MLYIILIIFILSFFLALRSMKDFQIPPELKKMLDAKKVKGTIIFLKNKVVHYK